MFDNSAWSHRNFRYYTYASVLGPFASQIQSLIIGWQIYEIKHDPLFLGLIGLVEALPALSLALISGTIVDRSNPLRVYRNVIRLAFLVALVLFVTSLPVVKMSDTRHLILLYAAAFCSGIGRGFRMPANTALVPKLVPRHVLHISSAWNTSGFAIASALGPALGGLLYGWVGPRGPFGVDVFCLFASLLLLTFVNIEYKKDETPKNSTAFQHVTAGIRYVFGHELLIAALALDMFAVLFGGAVAMLPIFAADILHVGPQGLGILRSAPSLGAVLGGLVLIKYPAGKKSGSILLAAVTGFGLCMIGFAVSTSFVLSIVILAFGGAFDSVSMVIRGAIVQLTAPDNMRGRIGAVNSIFIGVSNQLGEFESGVAAKLMGTVPSVIFGGVFTLVVVAITFACAPKLRSMELSKL